MYAERAREKRGRGDAATAAQPRNALSVGDETASAAADRRKGEAPRMRLAILSAERRRP